MKQFKREDFLEAGVSNTDEARCYFKLYGEDYFHVPHYVKSYRVSDTGIEVEYANGCSMSLGYVDA